MWAIYIHSNVRLPIGPLRVLIGAPELHHWHHDRDRDAGNYANISPLMDMLFGTYRCPDHEPEAFGISEPIRPQLPRPDAPPVPPAGESLPAASAVREMNDAFHPCPTPGRRGIARSGPAPRPFRPALPLNSPLQPSPGVMTGG